MGRERVPIAAKLDHENADFIDGLIKQFKPLEVSSSSARSRLKHAETGLVNEAFKMTRNRKLINILGVIFVALLIGILD